MRDPNVGSVVVVDDVGYLAGIVTDRDVAVRGVGEGRSGDLAVEQIMSNVATVLLHADVSDAAGIMAKRRPDTSDASTAWDASPPRHRAASGAEPDGAPSRTRLASKRPKAPPAASWRRRPLRRIH